MTRPEQKPKLNFKQLHNELVRVEFASEARIMLKKYIDTGADIEEDYANLQKALTSATDKVIPRVNKQGKQKLMNAEIVDLVDQRRKCKRGSKQYKQLDKSPSQ